jgi:SAM-dependent methyltransferase
MKPRKDDSCYCGSKLKYRDCHWQIDKAGEQHRVHAARRRYVKGWIQNAGHYEAQGCYEWLTARLKHFAPKRFFDIGCGDGRGILAVAKEFASLEFQLFSIEENPDCIQQARKNLARDQIQVSVIKRCEVVVRAPKTHAIMTRGGRLRTAAGVNLFEGDILADEEVEEFLLQQPRFDAVTAWLIGSHPVRHECYNIQGLNFSGPGEYRLKVQNKAYELANKILRVGGVLHIADRGEVLTSDDLRKDCLDGHREQAARMHTTLEVQDSVELKLYTEADAPNRVPMSATLGTSGRMADLSRLAIHSVISIKR